MVVKTLEDIRNNNIKPIPQTELAQEELKAAPKIFKEDCKIDWSKSGKAIVNHIRGLSPYPAAFTELDGLSCKIFRANFEASSHKKALGSYETDGKSTLHFFVKDGIVHIQELQLEGKKRMKTDEFLRGYRFKSGNSAH
jgi:methionyl-tRNA formyltransferase